MFKKLFRREAPTPFMGGDTSKAETPHELTPQLQQQLFELGRVTYLFLANAQTLAENVKALAMRIDTDEKKAAKKGRKRPKANLAGLTPVRPPTAAPSQSSGDAAGNGETASGEE